VERSFNVGLRHHHIGGEQAAIVPGVGSLQLLKQSKHR